MTDKIWLAICTLLHRIACNLVRNFDVEVLSWRRYIPLLSSCCNVACLCLCTSFMLARFQPRTFPFFIWTNTFTKLCNEGIGRVYSHLCIELVSKIPHSVIQWTNAKFFSRIASKTALASSFNPQSRTLCNFRLWKATSCRKRK